MKVTVIGLDQLRERLLKMQQLLKLTVGDDHDLEGVVCPHCNGVLLGAFGVGTQQEVAMQPGPGSINFCANCGELSRFTPEMKLRPLTDEEHMMLKDNAALEVARRSFNKRKQLE